MATDRKRTERFIERIREKAEDAIDPSSADPVAIDPAGLGRGNDEASIRARLERIDAAPEVIDELLDSSTRERLDRYEGVIEQFIGTAKIPIGVVGPLLVNGTHARGSYWIPLATSEATLIGSYTRGACAITRSGGVASLMSAESIARTPCFVFDRIHQAGRFVEWLASRFSKIKSTADGTSNYARLQDLRFTLDGNHVYVAFEFTTGDACGQNMTTIATEAACVWILEHTPHTPERWYLEGNLSGDKKASAQSYCLVRGRKVTADALIPATVLQEELKVTADAMADYWRVSALGGVLSGTLGVQGHFANGLAGLFIACGQDAACVAESAIGVTRLEARQDGALYASVTLPTLMVGSVGGATNLPTARACLDLLGIERDGGAAVLAEVAAGLLLAGELSLVASMVTGSFGRAHRILRRRVRPDKS